MDRLTIEREVKIKAELMNQSKIWNDLFAFECLFEVNIFKTVYLFV